MKHELNNFTLENVPRINKAFRYFDKLVHRSQGAASSLMNNFFACLTTNKERTLNGVKKNTIWIRCFHINPRYSSLSFVIQQLTYRITHDVCHHHRSLSAAEFHKNSLKVGEMLANAINGRSGEPKREEKLGEVLRKSFFSG